jgi:hypothetical protein
MRDLPTLKTMDLPDLIMPHVVARTPPPTHAQLSLDRLLSKSSVKNRGNAFVTVEHDLPL